MSTALVTGASSGIGRAIASTLVDHGFRVIGTSRNVESVPDPIPGVRYVPLDLTNDHSTRACAEAVGPVDVLVNNAGESQSGPFEELPRDALHRLFQLNVLGQVHLTQLLLPAMRERGAGRVIFVSSMLASFPLPFRSSYVATKSAIEGFAYSLRGEVSSMNIHVSVLEPGAIATGIGTRRTEYIAANSPYHTGHDTMLRHLNAHEEAGTRPESVAHTVISALGAAKPRARYAVGSNAPLAFAMHRLLPLDAVLRFVARRHGL